MTAFMTLATLFGTIGVGLILTAYFLNLNEWLSAHSFTYIVMNLVGAVLACISSVLIGSVPFTVLEGTWSVVSLIALIKKLYWPGTNSGDREVVSP